MSMSNSSETSSHAHERVTEAELPGWPGWRLRLHPNVEPPVVRAINPNGLMRASGEVESQNKSNVVFLVHTHDSGFAQDVVVSRTVIDELIEKASRPLPDPEVTTPIVDTSVPDASAQRWLPREIVDQLFVEAGIELPGATS